MKTALKVIHNIPFDSNWWLLLHKKILYILTFKDKHVNASLSSFEHYIVASLSMVIVSTNSSSTLNMHLKESMLSLYPEILC